MYGNSTTRKSTTENLSDFGVILRFRCCCAEGKNLQRTRVVRGHGKFELTTASARSGKVFPAQRPNMEPSPGASDRAADRRCDPAENAPQH